MLLGIHEEKNNVAYEKINSYEYVPIFVIRETEEMYNMRMDDITMSNHWHRSIEILYTNQSTGDIVINGCKYHLPEESLCIINSKDVHYIEMPSVARRYTGYTYQLNYQFLIDECPDFDNKIFSISEEAKQYIIPILETINRFYFDDVIKNKDIIISLCRALIETLLIHASKDKIQKISTTNTKLLELLDYIDHHYNHDLNLQEIAEKYHVSYTYLAKLFKDNLGISAMTYINKLRYEKALIDISTTKDTITDIAYNHGFPNVSSLIREFKKNKGMSPQAYRKLKDEGAVKKLIK